MKTAHKITLVASSLFLLVVFALLMMDDLFLIHGLLIGMGSGMISAAMSLGFSVHPACFAILGVAVPTLVLGIMIATAFEWSLKILVLCMALSIVETALEKPWKWLCILQILVAAIGLVPAILGLNLLGVIYLIALIVANILGLCCKEKKVVVEE